MYIESSCINHGQGKVFASSGRTDIIQITNIAFYYEKFSILNDDSQDSMGSCRIRLLLQDKTWSTQYTFAKTTQYRENSTD